MNVINDTEPDLLVEALHLNSGTYFKFEFLIIEQFKWRILKF